MRSLILLTAVGLLAQAQELPVVGAFRDDAGALRLVEGVPGAWTARALVREGVLSAGSSGCWIWYKTATELHVGTRDGEWRHVPAPEGPARGEFAATGEPARFLFPKTGEQAEWLAGADALGELRPAWIDEVEPPAQLGERWQVVRSAGVLAARDANGAEWTLPLAEAKQFDLYARGATETLVADSFVMPAAVPGETSEAKFRIRNLTAAPVLINRLSIDPGAFTTFDQFFPPRYLDANGFLDFSVRFAPAEAGSYSSTLYINDTKVTLAGSSVAVATVELKLDAGWQTLKSGSTTSLGNVERRSALTRALRVSQEAAVTLTGAGFTLAPGSAKTDYTVSVTSEVAGTATGTLNVDGRTFTLTAQVTEFATPTPALVLPEAAITPAQEVGLTVKLSEAAKAALTGTLTLTFAPAAGLKDDPAVAFLPSATRTVPVTIAEGASQSDTVKFQTGTTAGVITLALTLGSKTAQTALTLGAMPVSLTAAKASVASGVAQVTLTGYDVTRTVSKLAFVFYLTSGAAASPGTIAVDASPAFSAYWTSVTGGTFQLQATFPVSGTYTELAGVEVTVTNGSGAAQTGRLTF